MGSGRDRVLEDVALGVPLGVVLDRLAVGVEHLAEGLMCSVLLVDGDRLRDGVGPRSGPGGRRPRGPTRRGTRPARRRGGTSRGGPDVLRPAGRRRPTAGWGRAEIGSWRTSPSGSHSAWYSTGSPSGWNISRRA